MSLPAVLQNLGDYGRKAELGWHLSHARLQYWCKEAAWQVRFTPDMAYLQQYEWQLLFVPDEMMLRHSMSDFLRKDGMAVFRRMAFTNMQFRVYRTLEGANSTIIPLVQPKLKWIKEYSPVWKPSQTVADPAIMFGEVYTVRPLHFFALDSYKQNGVQFRRFRIQLHVPYRQIMQVEVEPYSKKFKDVLTNERATPVSAWMYVAKPSFWQDKLDWNHKPVKIQEPHRVYDEEKPWLRPYYYFSREELSA